jgi:hypothetical protein
VSATAGFTIGVEGVALWSTFLPGWECAQRILRGEEAAPTAPAPRPIPLAMPPAERRRASETVAIALDAAQSACAAAGRDPASLPCVFGSRYGDLPITDYLCATLANDPKLLSPTKFHNSVHNAPAAYWTIAVGCTRPYTSLAAGEQSFAVTLFEAILQSHRGAEPVLMTAYDIDARGALASVAPSRLQLASAFVLGVASSDKATVRWRVNLQPRRLEAPSRAQPRNEALVAGNAMAGCLPLFEALAHGGACRIVMPMNSSLSLVLEMQ